jgi:catechol 2,3-dioxygenase-like lactoylglutathione lyase family enzyme
MILESLGYQLFQEWEEGFSLKSGGTYIVFVQVEEQYKNNGYHRKNVGLNHLAFSVTNKREVDDLRTFLKDEGVPLLYDEQYPFAGGDNHYAVYFEDPDRIKLEVVAEGK